MGLLDLLAQTGETAQGEALDQSAVSPLLAAFLKLQGKRVKDAVTAPRDAYRGDLQVYDPSTGHVSDEAMSRAGEMAGLAMTGGLGGAGVKAGETALGAGPIRAYHGSPHNFDRFDISKLGSGEGAQAYGHGLYFAENEATAKAYRDALSAGMRPGESGWIVDGKPHTSLPPEQLAAFEHYLRTRDSAPLDAVGLGAAKINAAPHGRMYEVAIDADPAKMLDYDAALSKNHPVRGLLGDAARAAYDAADYGAGRNAAKDALLASRNENLTGGGAYNSLVRSLADAPAFVPGGKGYFKDAAANASEMLKDAGVPGLRYLDQGSRGLGEGSRNLVTFSDDIVSILRKYGIAGLSLLGVGQGAVTNLGMGPQPGGANR